MGQAGYQKQTESRLYVREEDSTLITIQKGTTKQFNHRLRKSPALHEPVTKDFIVIITHSSSSIKRQSDFLKLNLNLTFLLYKDCINSAFHFLIDLIP